MSVLYEVNIQVEPEIEKAYLGWLHAHVKAMLKQPGFIEAMVYTETDKKGFYVVHYRVASEQDLENYLLNEAPKMRADGVERFGEKFKVTRRVLKALDLASSITS